MLALTRMNLRLGLLTLLAGAALSFVAGLLERPWQAVFVCALISLAGFLIYKPDVMRRGWGLGKLLSALTVLLAALCVQSAAWFEIGRGITWLMR